MVCVIDLTEALGVMRRFVVFVVGVVVWTIAFVIRSKVRFLVVQHGCNVICIINLLCVFWKGGPV